MNVYKPVIGLEVHVELKTKSKMFCSCSADYFGKEPNTHVCPVCLGLPGALPVPNGKAIEWCIKIGLALNCQINEFSKFDRKNYFYPDLPKGYQISQYDLPFCKDGYVTLQNSKKIGITRVHMEEDTGKLTHSGQDSLIDFNRSGVPLVEIVTEPDFESAEEVVEYLKKLQQIVRYLEVSNADMEKGDMRLEPNISLRLQGTGDRGQLPKYKQSLKGLPPYKVEVKNINSFRFVDRAIKYEIKRQAEILDKGETPAQETRGWNEAKNATISQRSKEEAHDYRYFPEPDIPPITTSRENVDELKKSLPELPDEKLKRFQDKYGLSSTQAAVLTESRNLADFYEEAVKDGKGHNVNPVQIANYIINRKIIIEETLPAKVVEEILGKKAGVIVDSGELEKLAKEAIEENLKIVEDYKKGKETAVQALIGAVMRKSAGKADPGKVRAILKKLLV